MTRPAPTPRPEDGIAVQDWVKRVETAQNLLEMHDRQAADREYAWTTAGRLLAPGLGSMDHAKQVVNRAVSPTTDRTQPTWLTTLIATMRREWDLLAEAVAAEREIDLGNGAQITVSQDPGGIHVFMAESDEKYEGHASLTLPLPSARDLVLALLAQPAMREQALAVALRLVDDTKVRAAVRDKLSHF